jgi:hypothetical protein
VILGWAVSVCLGMLYATYFLLVLRRYPDQRIPMFGWPHRVRVVERVAFLLFSAFGVVLTTHAVGRAGWIIPLVTLGVGVLLEAVHNQRAGDTIRTP